MPKALFKALRFDLAELLKWDFLIGVGFAAAGVWMALNAPERLNAQVIPAAIGIVGVVIGAVVAGAAILGAFLDQAFLRKLKRIERDSTYYIAPFLFTAFLGTVAIILLLVLLALTPSGLAWLRALLAGATGLSTGWTLGSLIYDLDMLVQFLQLQDAAADVPDSGDEGNVRPMPRAHPDS
jgi:MFS family permease